jgi:hypothetical protein
MSPLEGRVHHIVYMFIHLSCMYRKENRFPLPRFTPPDEKRWMIKKGVRERLIVKMKLRASKGEVARLRSP